MSSYKNNIEQHRIYRAYCKNIFRSLSIYPSGVVRFYKNNVRNVEKKLCQVKTIELFIAKYRVIKIGRQTRFFDIDFIDILNEI